ncbi:MAG: type II toxin-antitoxin system RelE/ParE family toxin [Bacteroidales bacterium]|nr:type II toxin-antitoxin system RelE/ParE family toxin [Bacteroidales bacterium]
MHEIHFYRDKNGKEPVLEYMRELKSKHDKNSHIKLHKIQDYIKILRANGKSAGEPYIKHIDGDIWELRPLRNRILFAGWVNGGFVLLHHFMKKTQKTPTKEIEQAKRELTDLRERSKQR